MLEDPRLSKNKVRVPRRDNYEKRPVLSATIHPDIKKTLVSMSERTGLSISQPYVVAWMSQLQSSFKPLSFIFSLAAQSGLHRKVTGEDAVLVVEKSVCG